MRAGLVVLPDLWSRLGKVEKKVGEAKLLLPVTNPHCLG